MQTPVVNAGGALMDMPPPPPCTSAYIEGTGGPGSTDAASPPPMSDGGTGDALHAERMEYIRQLVQERDSLATTEGCEVARRLIEQGKVIHDLQYYFRIFYLARSTCNMFEKAKHQRNIMLTVSYFRTALCFRSSYLSQVLHSNPMYKIKILFLL